MPWGSPFVGAQINDSEEHERILAEQREHREEINWNPPHHAAVDDSYDPGTEPKLVPGSRWPFSGLLDDQDRLVKTTLSEPESDAGARNNGLPQALRELFCESIRVAPYVFSGANSFVGIEWVEWVPWVNPKEPPRTLLESGGIDAWSLPHAGKTLEQDVETVLEGVRDKLKSESGRVRVCVKCYRFFGPNASHAGSSQIYCQRACSHAARKEQKRIAMQRRRAAAKEVNSSGRERPCEG